MEAKRREEGAVEPIREKIEDLLRRWRSRYEGNRVLRVLAWTVAILLALRALRAFRALGSRAAIVAIVVGGWLLISSLLLPIPRLSSDGPVVRNGVAAVVACGNKRGIWGMGAVEIAPEPRTGTWGTQRRRECTVYYHHPPDPIQRKNRHERAEREQRAH